MAMCRCCNSTEQNLHELPFQHFNNMQKNLARASILAATCLAACNVNASPGATLCSDNEEPIFACSLENAKKIALCRKSTEVEDYLTYRYGTNSKVELTFEATDKEPKRRFYRGEVLYANNSEETIWFKNGGYLYSIYLPTRGRPGLEVTRGGEPISKHQCKAGWKNVKKNLAARSEYIIDHGRGDLSKFQLLWDEK